LAVVAVLLGACEGPSGSSSEAAEAEASRTPAKRPAAAAALLSTRDQRVAALRKSLSRPLSRSIEGLKVEALPNGKSAVHLEGRFGHATMLRINPDGTRERGCFDDAERAIEFATRGEAKP